MSTSSHNLVSSRSTPKVSSRPRSILPSKLGATPPQPSPVPSIPNIHHRSQPLTTSHNINSAPAQHHHYSIPNSSFDKSFLLSPPAALSNSTTKLKIKSTTTPEARTRLLRPIVPAKTPASTRYDILGGGNGSGRATKMMPAGRGMTPSDSNGSLDAWVGSNQPESGQDVVLDLGAEEGLGEKETVLVTVRVRPPNEAELRTDSSSAWITEDDHTIKIARGRDGLISDREWLFDRILTAESTNAKAYSTSAKTHVRSAMEGYNAVIFAYGQTASGKTFTLSGSPSDPGIIPLSIYDLFSQIRKTPDREFLLRASYLELYNETIIDLLGPEGGRELTLSEGKKKGEVVVNGLTECAVRTEEEVRRLLKVGEDRRKVGGTDWNQRSSRSHCVFRIVIESRAHGATEEGPIGSRTPGGRLKAAGEKMTRISTLSIIDLAGSEKHTSSKERNAEGKHINQSLLTLKMVISKLADVATGRTLGHVPYRDSKLTRLLQPSLSGDALISVICTISPSPVNQAESLSTLSFAQGIKRVVLRAQKKEVIDPQALIQQYQNEIAELKALLREKENTGTGGIGLGFGGDVMGSMGEKQRNIAAEKRLNELKSLILTSVTVSSSAATREGNIEARPLSPTKLKYPKLNFDKSTVALQEDLHAAELKVSEHEDEIARLRMELECRPLDPDMRIVELQEEIDQLKMIAADYERHLLEPSRKVREDVEKEWIAKLAKVEDQLESKTIWANRLDENIRAVTEENRGLRARCDEAEAKFNKIMEWIDAALEEDEPITVQSASSSSTYNPDDTYPVPSPKGITEGDDFSPSLGLRGGLELGLGGGTVTLNTNKMRRQIQLSTMDLAGFSERFGSLAMRGGGGVETGSGVGGGGSGGKPSGRGMKLLKEESRFDLSDRFGGDGF